MKKLSPLRGMQDIFQGKCRIYKYIEDVARSCGNLYGYDEISIPVIENIRVFDRTLGENSDVVSKEIYSFFDKKNRHIALRPEFTAGTMRAIISNNMTHNRNQKFFLTGPVFRYDRPQEGRYRQFHQLNFEHIRSTSSYDDAEIIILANEILEKLLISHDVILEINSLGCDSSREDYISALTEYFKKYQKDLSIESQVRLEKNPLRILDSKNEKDKEIILDSPQITKYYTKESQDYFDNVLGYLNKCSIKYNINPRLVRGLDYYCHTAFEFTTTKLGSQSTILAGGRYDPLSKLIGSKETIPSIGFAAGVERIALMREFKDISHKESVSVIPIGDNIIDYSIKITQDLRIANISTILKKDGKLNKRIQESIAYGSKFIVFVGEDEMYKSQYKLKKLDSGDEMSLGKESLLREIKLSI